jgi:hypothetical protein
MTERFLVQLLDGGTVTEHVRVYSTSGVGVVETTTIVTLALEEAKAYTDTEVSDLADSTAVAIDAHATDTTGVHGIADTALLETQAGAQAKADAAQDAAELTATTAVEAHRADTTDVHGIADTALLDPALYAKLHEPNVFDVAAGSIPVLAWDDTGVAWFGEVEEGKDFNDGGQMRSMGLIIRPHVSGDHPGRVYGPSGINVFAPGDPPEFAGVIAGGTLASGAVASAQLVLGVPDVTALVNGELSLDAGYDPGTQWPVTAPVIDDDGDLEGVRDRKIQLQDGATHVANLTYTGRNDALRKLTGVNYVSHTGSVTFNSVTTRVYRYVGKGGTGLAVLGLADMGGGTQVRMANLSFIADEDQKFDGYGHYNAGGAIQFAPSTLGPWSMRKRRALWGARGDLWFYGSQARQPTTPEVDLHRRLVVSPENTSTRAAMTIPATPTTPYTINVRDPAGLPVPGAGGWPTPLYLQVTTTVPSQIEIAYTGYAATAGQWYLTGCTSAVGTAGLTIPIGANIDLARRNLGPVVGVKGNVVAYDLISPEDAGRTEIGAVGPLGEGGIKTGITGSQATLYKAAPNVWAMGPAGATLAADAYRMAEIADPAAPAVNNAVLYTRDNGAGKTQLCVRFNTGAIQVISTQP